MGMKNIFPTLLLAAAAVPAFAAEGEAYVPMIREGRVWEYSGFGGFKEEPDQTPMFVYHFIKFDGSVHLNGETYSRAVLFKTILTERPDDDTEKNLIFQAVP